MWRRRGRGHIEEATSRTTFQRNNCQIRNSPSQDCNASQNTQTLIRMQPGFSPLAGGLSRLLSFRRHAGLHLFLPFWVAEGSQSKWISVFVGAMEDSAQQQQHMYRAERLELNVVPPCPI